MSVLALISSLVHMTSALSSTFIGVQVVNICAQITRHSLSSIITICTNSNLLFSNSTILNLGFSFYSTITIASMATLNLLRPTPKRLSFPK